MVVSAAKLEANRRNAQKSTGPRTTEGKDKSKLNAVTHGLRAETLIVLNEDPQALDERREAWRASLLPGDDVEQRAVEDAVVYSWMQDRARRAQAARLSTNIANAGVDAAKREADEVLRLGQKLFSDHRAPLATYPHIDVEKDYYPPGIPRFPVRAHRPSPGPAAPGPAPPSDSRRLSVDDREVVRAEVDPRGRLRLAVGRQVQGRPPAGPAPAGGRR